MNISMFFYHMLNFMYVALLFIGIYAFKNGGFAKPKLMFSPSSKAET
jgi:hypothetical protein